MMKIGYVRVSKQEQQALLTRLVERAEDEQHVEGECLFLSLVHTACRAYPEHLLYPVDKKLLIGDVSQNIFRHSQETFRCTVDV